MIDVTVGGIVSLCAVFLFLTTGTLILRFFAQYKQGASIGKYDWTIAVAWVSLHCGSFFIIGNYNSLLTISSSS